MGVRATFASGRAIGGRIPMGTYATCSVNRYGDGITSGACRIARGCFGSKGGGGGVGSEFFFCAVVAELRGQGSRITYSYPGYNTMDDMERLLGNYGGYGAHFVVSSLFPGIAGFCFMGACSLTGGSAGGILTPCLLNKVITITTFAM